MNISLRKAKVLRIFQGVIVVCRSALSSGRNNPSRLYQLIPMNCAPFKPSPMVSKFKVLIHFCCIFRIYQDDAGHVWWWKINFLRVLFCLCFRLRIRYQRLKTNFIISTAFAQTNSNNNPFDKDGLPTQTNSNLKRKAKKQCLNLSRNMHINRYESRSLVRIL